MASLAQASQTHNGYHAPASDYEPATPPPMVPKWNHQEPRHVHSLKWIDGDGVEHLHVVRADSIDEALVQIKTLKTFIRMARAKDAPHADSDPQAATPATTEGWCATHQVWMQASKTGKGHFHKIGSERTARPSGAGESRHERQRLVTERGQPA